jgi:hypothetical protein
MGGLNNKAGAVTLRVLMCVSAHPILPCTSYCFTYVRISYMYSVLCMWLNRLMLVQCCFR